ncbi:hypothetical protein K503DRAFT_775805 [Rhizopogon vinicolor AM-OR11-026]|uniref:J domain-containing protein n=1 Tax=Rhizopogon vinicolor AM-OR11-026 TaxID=1314800 RepID=A0A1B7MKY1_9AGAM|nr:hypothetical protein K503DRAFT_775805 [Rhizopogon vinicolor AM-OR11-026]
MLRVPYTFHSPVRTLLTTRVNSSRLYASKSANPFPYPTQTNPQPHHIFHLPRNASQDDVKQRYYELVRIYHPDSAVARHYPPEVSQARFQSISKAYDILRGKTSSGEPTEATRKVDPMRWAAKSRRPYFDDTASDEKWKERVITGAVLLTLVAFVAQTSWTRQQAIAEMSSHGRASGSSMKSGRGDSALAADHEDRTLHGSINHSQADLHNRR